MFLAGIFDARKPADQALADFASPPGGVLALHIQDELLHMERQPMRIVMGPPAFVGQPLNATFLIAIEYFVASLLASSKKNDLQELIPASLKLA